MGSGPVVRFHDRGVLNPQCTNLLCKIKAEMHCKVMQLGSEASTNGRQVQPLALPQNILCSLHLLLQAFVARSRWASAFFSTLLEKA